MLFANIDIPVTADEVNRSEISLLFSDLLLISIPDIVMKSLTTSCIVFLFFYSCKPNSLENKTQTLELQYVSWGCVCANWAAPMDIKRFADSSYQLSKSCVYVEPANKDLVLPDTIRFATDRIRFTGQFYEREGYPKEYIATEEQLDKAKIFRYTKYEVLQSGYRDFINNAKE